MFAAGAAVAQAAILGWPPLVCALVTLPAPARAVPPAVLVAGLAAVALVIAGVAAAADATRASRETTFAFLAVLLVTLLAAQFAWGGAWLEAVAREAARAPQIPELPPSWDVPGR
jgi:hypothetical protein